jgi:hypothetical protein
MTNQITKVGIFRKGNSLRSVSLPCTFIYKWIAGFEKFNNRFLKKKKFNNIYNVAAVYRNILLYISNQWPRQGYVAGCVDLDPIYI